ncbi:MAG: RDD family protein [Bacteroides sp.]|nr:RDD family protein [Bacteroides sp.]
MKNENEFWRCNACGTVNPTTFAFCQHCMKPIDWEEEVLESDEHRQSHTFAVQEDSYPSQRFIGLVVDALVCVLFAIGFYFLFGNALDYVVGVFIMLLIVIAYFTLLEWLCGRTLGKVVAGTCVRNKKGRNISFWQALGRTLLRYLGIIDLLVFFFAGRPLHDIFTCIRVVIKR